MSDTDLVAWEEADLTARAESWPDRAKALAIVDDESCVRAAEFLKGIKDLRKEVDEAYDGIIAKAFAAHREAVAKKKHYEAPLLEAERVIKTSLAAYHTEQERKRQEEQRRLEAIARQQEEDRRLAEAADLERQALAGPEPDLEALYDAHQLIEQPVETPVVSVAPPTPKVSGVSYRETWKADPAVDLRALCRAIADGTQPTTLVLPNMPALNGLARSLKGQAKVPGVRFVVEKTVAAGGR